VIGRELSIVYGVLLYNHEGHVSAVLRGVFIVSLFVDLHAPEVTAVQNPWKI